jgi:hypothetical protein
MNDTLFGALLAIPVVVLAAVLGVLGWAVCGYWTACRRLARYQKCSQCGLYLEICKCAESDDNGGARLLSGP